jgi:hypothetical protein
VYSVTVCEEWAPIRSGSVPYQLTNNHIQFSTRRAKAIAWMIGFCRKSVLLAGLDIAVFFNLSLYLLWLQNFKVRFVPLVMFFSFPFLPVSFTLSAIHFA